jgi:medium-chain acyl-[acyl-carrier-protein] hydrolase
VTDLHCEILPLLDKPFAFFGHSLGALIAFELIRSLQKVGKEPQIFFASAHRPPKQPLYKPPIHQLPEQLFEEKIQQYGGTPSLILEDAELKKFFFSILRADFTLWETYRYSSGERLACPIVLLAGKQDVTVSLDDLPLWQEETSSRCPLYLLNGGHFFLKDSQKEVIEIIQRELSSCTAH